MTTTRRDFLKKAAFAGAGIASTTIGMNAAEKQNIIVPQKKRTTSKSGKIRVGFIGTGFRSQEHFNNILSFPDTEVVAICDISDFSLNMTKETFKKEKKTFQKCTKGANLSMRTCLRKKNSMSLLFQVLGNGMYQCL